MEKREKKKPGFGGETGLVKMANINRRSPEISVPE